ncbi:MAG TPA: response regulator [Bacteroidetes bacterium]|nr:response regulator [Bacteroidota bacterium]
MRKLVQLLAVWLLAVNLSAQTAEDIPAHTFGNELDADSKKKMQDMLLDVTSKYNLKFNAQEKHFQEEIAVVKREEKEKAEFFLYAAIGMLLLLLGSVVLAFQNKKRYKNLLAQKEKEVNELEDEIGYKSVELETKSISLDLLNKKLVHEISAKEALERSSFARDRFLATMSNEMRNPLNSITGLTHVLLQNDPKPGQVEQLRSLQFSANDLVVFINDILDFSKIEAGKLDLEDRPFSPKELVREVAKRFESKADEKELRFNFYFDKKIPKTLLGDNARFHQILTNLLTNTLKYTRDGYVKLDVSLYELKAREAMLKVIVEGSDGGVDRRTIEEMFRPQNTMQPDFEGYDNQQFSLAITKRLVELQNGKIDVEVEQGEGTSFVVLLPFRLALQKREKKKMEEIISPSSLAGTRILIVEDNKINQLVVSKILKRLDAKTTLANNGIEALEIIENQDFDLILMDIQMPQMDGYRATAEIRKHPDENKRQVPIIALTASAFLTEREKAVLFGMNDHVGKPFSPDELVEKINNCLAAFEL